MADYSKMSTDDFDRILRTIVADMNGEQLLDFAGVYEIVSEELNNEVLAVWAEEQPEPEDEDEEEEEEGDDAETQ